MSFSLPLVYYFILNINMWQICQSDIILKRNELTFGSQMFCTTKNDKEFKKTLYAPFMGTMFSGLSVCPRSNFSLNLFCQSNVCLTMMKSYQLGTQYKFSYGMIVLIQRPLEGLAHFRAHRHPFTIKTFVFFKSN